MSQLKNVVDPFGEVNVYPGGPGKKRVVATILMEPHKEGAQTGIALDGSGSMAKLYGVNDGSRVLSPIFGGPKKHNNEITPVAQQLCAYLANKIDADGGTTCIYWAVGQNGGQIEIVGDLRAEEAERHVFGPPKEFGTGTQLLPAVKYFVERFKDAPWGFYVFITDGELHDLDAVKQYSVRLAHDISARKRLPLKFVLIGIGPDVNEAQMVELDDLDSGTEVDLWDHKLAAEMRVLQEIFAEVVDKNTRIADKGRILDPQGRVVKDYSDTGLPAFLEFEIAASADFFTLDVNNTKVHQGLTDNVRTPTADVPTLAAADDEAVPVSRLIGAREVPTLAPVDEPRQTTPARSAPSLPARTVPPAAPATPVADDEDDALWKSIDLEMEPKRDTPDIDLDQAKDK